METYMRQRQLWPLRMALKAQVRIMEPWMLQSIPKIIVFFLRQRLLGLVIVKEVFQIPTRVFINSPRFWLFCDKCRVSCRMGLCGFMWVLIELPFRNWKRAWETKAGVDAGLIFWAFGRYFRQNSWKVICHHGSRHQNNPSHLFQWQKTVIENGTAALSPAHSSSANGF